MARKKSDNGNGVTLLGVLGGAAIGAAVALVYSPAKGETNRQHFFEWAQSRVNNVLDKAQEKLDRGGH